MTKLPFPSALVFPNEQVLQQAGGEVRKACQDHAVALGDRELGLVVLAVADGVSTIRTLRGDEPSHTQAGGVLAAEIAAAAAMAGLRGVAWGPDQVEWAVREGLRTALLPLAAALGARTSLALASTLLLAVATDEWSAIWTCGDGSWGLATSSEARVVGTDGAPMVGEPVDGGVYHGADIVAPGNVLHDSVLKLVGGKNDALVRGALVEGAVSHLWVATDGLRFEAAARDLLVRGSFTRADLVKRMARPQRCDDLAIAFACGIGGV